MQRTSEREALVRAVRAILAGEALPPAALDGADPARLLAEAARHECAPLLWSALAPDGLTGPAAARLPSPARDALRLAYHRNGLRNQVIRERLEALLADLARRGVAAMPLKGAVLAFAAYRAPDQRPLGDLDLLVREADFPAVAETLAAHGYRTDAPPLPPRALPRHAHTVRQVRFGAARVPPVEVHFRLLNLGPPAPAEAAWSDAAAWRLGSLEVPVPSPERFLLHLALHAQQHGHCLLRLAADLAVHRAAFPVDAERFAALAREHHLAGAAWLSLRLAADLFDRPEIAAPAAGLTPSRPRRLVLQALWRPRRALALAAPRWPLRAELPRAYLLSEAPWRDKLAWAAAVLTGILAGRRRDPPHRRAREAGR